MAVGGPPGWCACALGGHFLGGPQGAAFALDLRSLGPAWPSESVLVSSLYSWALVGLCALAGPGIVTFGLLVAA